MSSCCCCRGPLLEVADRRNYEAKRRGRGRAVNDDLVTSGRLPSAVLLERDEALTTAQDFPVRLDARGRGALRVTGPRGAGRSRFLTEVANLAAARGFDVRVLENGTAHPVPGPGSAPDMNAGPSCSTRMLIVADSDQDPDAAEKAVCDLGELADARAAGRATALDDIVADALAVDPDSLLHPA